MKSNKEIMKSKRKVILIGQVALILMVGITVDKVIQVNTKSPYQDGIIPYTSSFETETLPDRSVPAGQVSRGSVLRSAEDVWADQEGKFFEAEDRYSNVELAEMIMSGELTKAERIITIDQYIKKDIEKEIGILTAIKKADELKAKQAEKALQESAKKINMEYANASYISTTNDYQTVDGYKTIKAFPYNTTFKSYMPWTALSPKYAQGQLLAKATPDPETAIMTYEGRYLVALGFAYADMVGEKIDVVMEDGTVIPVMIGDFKALEHTDDNNSITVHDGSIIEFIVSSSTEAAKVVKQTGNYNTIFPGKIKEFRKIV